MFVIANKKIEHFTKTRCLFWYTKDNDSSNHIFKTYNPVWLTNSITAVTSSNVKLSFFFLIKRGIYL